MAVSVCPAPELLDQSDAVDARCGAAALEREGCLCTPVGFDPAVLQVIAGAVVGRD